MKFDFKDPRRQRKITVITVLLVVLAGIIASYIRSDGEDPGYLTFHNEGYLSMRDALGAKADVYYADITDIRFLTETDYGKAVDGALVDEVYRLGRWNSGELGSYLSCTDMRLTACIWIQTEQDVYVINYLSDETTEALYGAILRAREELLRQ